MSGAHTDLGPELRQLAQSILDRLDPVVRLAAARAQAGGNTPGKCQQVWCPVCALAALIAGEQHPLLNIVAEHSVALLTLVRAMVDDLQTVPPPDPDGPPDGDRAPTTASEPGGPGRYQHIPVIVEE